jgi:pyridoxine 5-phosphate synthase
MIKLGVNIDHVATLRQARKEDFPSPLTAASICEKAGADSITAHLREDRRHIQDKDVYAIKDQLRTRLNFEMAASDEIIKIALDLKPYSVCIVPEKRQEITTEGGLDVFSQKQKLKTTVKKLKDSGIIVSMFIDPKIEQVEACAEIQADAVELHTGKYARIYKSKLNILDEIEIIKEASMTAARNNLIVNAGHGLDYKNVRNICALGGFNEFNIGFAIIAQSIFDGLEKSVRDMKDILSGY